MVLTCATSYPDVAPTDTVSSVFLLLKRRHLVPTLKRGQLFLCHSSIGLGVLNKHATLEEEGVSSDSVLFLLARYESGGLQPKNPEGLSH